MMGEAFYPLACYRVPLRPKYSPQHPILKHTHPTFLPQHCRANLSKNAALVQSPLLEAHGYDSQNIRRLHSAEIDNVFRMARGR